MFATAILVASASSGTTPWKDALAGASAPSDFATDFVPAARLWRGASPRVDVVTGNAEAARLGAPGYTAVGVPFGAHPPPAVLLVAALVPLGFRAAALAWLLLSLGGLAVVAWVATETLAPRGHRRTATALATFAALALWPPALHNIEKGQWSLIVAGHLAGAWWATTRGRHRLAGALVAIAGSFKVMPLLVLPALLSPGRWRRVVVGAGGAMTIAIATSMIVVGPEAWTEFARSAPINTRGWQTGPANTLSIWGALCRLFVGGPFARPFFAAPAAIWVARGLWMLTAVGLVAVALRLTFRWTSHRSTSPEGSREGLPLDARRQAPVFAAWTVLAIVLGPLSWSHVAIELVLPIALLAHALRKQALEDRPGPGFLRAVLGLAAVVLTIPRMTLFGLAGPLPVTPGRGLALGAHLCAALAIFVVAVVVPRRS